MRRTAVHAQGSAHEASATAGHAGAEAPDVELQGGSFSQLQLLRLVDEALAAMAAGRRPEMLDAMRAAGQHQLADQVEDERDVRLTLDGQTREERAEWINWVRAWRGEEAATRVEAEARRRWREGDALRGSSAPQLVTVADPTAKAQYTVEQLEQLLDHFKCAGTLQPVVGRLLPMCIGCERRTEGPAALMDVAAISQEPGYTPAWACAARLPRARKAHGSTGCSTPLPQVREGARFGAAACTTGELDGPVRGCGSFHALRHAGPLRPDGGVVSGVSSR